MSTWLTVLRLCIPCLFLHLPTAMFPLRQEVNSVSCHSPLSCGHFLLFCQHRSDSENRGGGGGGGLHVGLRNNGERSSDDVSVAV